MRERSIDQYQIQYKLTNYLSFRDKVLSICALKFIKPSRVEKLISNNI